MERKPEGRVVAVAAMVPRDLGNIEAAAVVVHQQFL